MFSIRHKYYEHLNSIWFILTVLHAPIGWKPHTHTHTEVWNPKTTLLALRWTYGVGNPKCKSLLLFHSFFLPHSLSLLFYLYYLLLFLTILHSFFASFPFMMSLCLTLMRISRFTIVTVIIVITLHSPQSPLLSASDNPYYTHTHTRALTHTQTHWEKVVITLL